MKKISIEKQLYSIYIRKQVNFGNGITQNDISYIKKKFAFLMVFKLRKIQKERKYFKNHTLL